MGSRLINVRLDEERARKASKLRARGVVLSDLVRDAIDQRFAEVMRPTATVDAASVIAALFERWPDPPDLESRAYDVHDARQARLAVRRRLPARTT